MHTSSAQTVHVYMLASGLSICFSGFLRHATHLGLLLVASAGC